MLGTNCPGQSLRESFGLASVYSLLTSLELQLDFELSEFTLFENTVNNDCFIETFASRMDTNLLSYVLNELDSCTW